MVAVTITVLHNIHLLIQYSAQGLNKPKFNGSWGTKYTHHSNDTNINIVMQKVIMREIKV